MEACTMKEQQNLQKYLKNQNTGKNFKTINPSKLNHTIDSTEKDFLFIANCKISTSPYNNVVPFPLLQIVLSTKLFMNDDDIFFSKFVRPD